MTIPITPEMLREDWIDDPALSPEQKQELEALDDRELDDALTHVFSTWYADQWYQILDEVRSGATGALLNRIQAAKETNAKEDDGE